MSKEPFNLVNLNVLAKAPLELAVRKMRHGVVEACRKRCLQLADPAQALLEPGLSVRSANGLSLASVCQEAAEHLGELCEVIEVEASHDGGQILSNQDDSTLVAAMSPFDFLSGVAKLLANLADFSLAFRLLDGLAQLPGRVADMLDAATVVMFVKRSALTAVRYLVFSKGRSPAEDVLRLLRVVRLLALAGRLRSAMAAARIVLRSTRGMFRKDAMQAVQAIQQRYLAPAVRLAATGGAMPAALSKVSAV
jgi:hypothetical protein